MSTTPIQLPALEPPKYYSPFDARAKLMNLQNLAQQQQIGQQQLQSGQLTIEGQQNAIAQRKAIDQAYRNAWALDENGKPQLDENGKPQFDDAKFSQALAAAGHGSAATPILEANTKYRKSLADLDKVKGEVELAERNSAGHLAAGVQAGNNDPHLFLTHVTQGAHSGAITPAHAKLLTDPVTAALDQDPTGETARALVKQITDQMIAGSPKERELQTASKTAESTQSRNKAQGTLADLNSLQKGMEITAQSMPIPAPVAPGVPPALPTQEEWDAWRNTVTDPRIKAKILPKPSPTAIALVKQMGLTRDQQRQADQAAATLAETKYGKSTPYPPAVQAQKVEEAGAMAGARTNVLLSPQKEAQEIRIAGAKAEAVAEQKPATEPERKALNFHDRMRDAENVISNLASSMVKKNVGQQSWFEFAPNFLQSENNQLYRQAQRQFTEARLRKESGALISPSEYANDRQTYFPQPGDTAAVLERKRKGREVLLNGLRRESGRAYEAAYGTGGPAPAADTGTKPATHRYNPATGQIEEIK